MKINITSRKRLFLKFPFLFLSGVGLVLFVLSVLKFAWPDNYGVIQGKIVDQYQKGIASQIIKINEGDEVLTNEEGNFLLGSLAPGKHSLYLEESLANQAHLTELEIKAGERKEVILLRKPPTFPLGTDELPQEYLIAATQLWAKNRKPLYVFNSAILADMLSPYAVKLAFKIHTAGGSDLDKMLNIIAFEQQNFVHLDDLVPPNPEEAYTWNELWGRVKDEQGGSSPLSVLEIPEIANAYQNVYGSGKRAFRCEGFAIFNAALLRLLGFSIDQVMTVDLWGEVGHVITLANTEDGLFMFSNQYLHQEKGKGVFGDSKIFGRAEEEKDYVFEEHGVDALTNDYYNVFTPEVVVNNLEKEKLEKIYQDLIKITGTEIPAIKEFDHYPKGQEPLIPMTEYLEGYQKGEAAWYPLLKTKITDYQNWTAFYNALKQEIWEKANFYPDSPYTYAKYNSHSLWVKKPEIYAQAALAGVKLPEIVAFLSNPEEIREWIKNNITKATYTEPTQVMLPDEVITLKSGRPQDKALLAFSLLKSKGIEAEIVMGEKNSYLVISQEGKKEIWDMNLLSKIEAIPEDPLLIFNDQHSYSVQTDTLPSEFKALSKSNPDYFKQNIKARRGQDFPWWKLDWSWGVGGFTLLISGIIFIIINKKRRKKYENPF